MDKRNNNFCSESDEHSHNHSKLHSHPDEDPAIFSVSITLQLDSEISRQELELRLIKWFEKLLTWTKDNHFFIGHIKSFIENEDNLHLWLATTGKKISVKNTAPDTSLVRIITINFTAIIYGPDEELLSKTVIDELHHALKKDITKAGN